MDETKIKIMNIKNQKKKAQMSNTRFISSLNKNNKLVKE